MTIFIYDRFDMSEVSEKQQHYHNVWLDIIKYLETQTDPKKIVSFLAQVYISDIDEVSHVVTIGVPNDFVLVQVKKFFGELLSQAIKTVYHAQYSASIAVVSTVHDVYLVDLKKVLSLHSSDSPKSRQTTQSAPHRPIDTDVVRSLGDYFGVLFDRRFQFENYIVGANNEFAYALMERIAQSPGQEFNPFFLHGHVGLGKTHLLQATANRIIELYPHKTVVYLPTPKMVDDIISSIKKNKLDQYKKKFEGVDVLILDDVQFLANKDKCQEIFFMIFNDFIQEKKQLILSGDRPPRELTLIEMRLTTRFALGTICEISMPDFETRAAIVQSKSELKELHLSSELIELIAKTIVDNVRELEGVVNTLATKHHILGRDIIYSDVIECLSTLGYQVKGKSSQSHTSPQQSVGPRFDDVVAAICLLWDVTQEDLAGDSKKKQVSVPRQCSMYCAKHHFGWTFERIGEYFGGKHYSSVMYAIETFGNNMKQDEQLAMLYQQLCQQTGM